MSKFSLQRVLDFKEQVEDVLQLEVASIEGRRLEIQHSISALRNKWEETSADARGNNRVPLDAARVQASADYLDVLDQQIRAALVRLDLVEAELLEKRQQLTTAYQEREMLSRLKERHVADEQKTEQRLTNRTLEEVATTQYLRQTEDKGDRVERVNQRTGSR
jgi:flagellar FliJ protein